MSSAALSIDLVSWVMRLEQGKVEQASNNIARVNQPGATALKTDFAGLIANIRPVAIRPDMDRSVLQSTIQTSHLPSYDSKLPIALDSEVADLTSAELRYRTLAEGLSRQFTLLSLAASGKQ